MLTCLSFGQVEVAESHQDSVWYEIIKSPKHVEHFTTEGVVNLEVKLRELRRDETVYYNVSEWTTVKIYPTKNIKL